ncbi:hypothetical protein ILYODFUR_032806 [Ilyodon furcidens]|uniref:Uncharacterized protein n=1 Tax=Ilyodon furcidens TaxID=33524 RepID=A0ABV0UNU6_9TELE
MATTEMSVSQSFSTAYSIVGHGGAGAYLQQSMGERQGPPWTGRQSVTGPTEMYRCNFIFMKKRQKAVELSIQNGTLKDYFKICSMENDECCTQAEQLKSFHVML